MEVVTHLHNDDSVAASDAYNVASRYDRPIFNFPQHDSLPCHKSYFNVTQQSHSNTTTILFPCHSSPIPDQYSLVPMSQQPCYSCGKKQSIEFSFVLRVPGFLDSDEAPLLERLIEAYREKDSDALEQCCNNAVFRSMDTEVQAQPYTVASFPGSFSMQ